MFPRECAPTRRQFLMTSAAFTTAASGLTLLSPPALSEESDINILGPKKGYSPPIGTLVSMMTWMRTVMLMSVKGMSQKDLDYLFDPNANTIGSLLMHLAATDRIYQINTFEGNNLKDLPGSYKDKWGVAMELGEPARKAIKGHDLDYYLNLLSETREQTLRSSASATTIGSWRSTRPGAGVRPITIASGSTSANTNRTTTARSSS